MKPDMTEKTLATKADAQCAHRVLFVLPSPRERVSNHTDVFAKAGFKLSIAIFHAAGVENARKLFTEIMQDWGRNLVCVFHPPFDFCDRWLIDTEIHPLPGSIRDFLASFESAGIPVHSAEMDWDGPFDDDVCIYDSRIPDMLHIARGNAKKASQRDPKSKG